MRLEATKQALVRVPSVVSDGIVLRHGVDTWSGDGSEKKREGGRVEGASAKVVPKKMPTACSPICRNTDSAAWLSW